MGNIIPRGGRDGWEERLGLACLSSRKERLDERREE